MRNRLLSILMLFTIGMTMAVSYTSCKNATKTEASSEIVTPGDVSVLSDGTTSVPEAPTSKTDITMLITALFGVYEIIARLIKTKANLSIIDFVWAFISLVIPNKSKSGDVHIKF